MNATFSGYYKLDGHTPIPAADLLDWAAWFQKAKRHVAETLIGDVYVSTVFLGLDHGSRPGGVQQVASWPGGGVDAFPPYQPVLFETMIFGGEHDGYQERYHTWEEAEVGHVRALRLVHGFDADTPLVI